MGFVKRGVFKNKGSGKGNLWESSRTPLHLAYTYDQSDPSHSLVFMRLRVAPRDAPSLLGMHHGHYDVNLYHMPELPSRHLSWRSRDVSSRALAAFDAAVKMVRDELRDKRIYVLRKTDPDAGLRRAPRRLSPSLAEMVEERQGPEGPRCGGGGSSLCLGLAAAMPRPLQSPPSIVSTRFPGELAR